MFHSLPPIARCRPTTRGHGERLVHDFVNKLIGEPLCRADTRPLTKPQTSPTSEPTYACNTYTRAQEPYLPNTTHINTFLLEIHPPPMLFHRKVSVNRHPSNTIYRCTSQSMAQNIKNAITLTGFYAANVNNWATRQTARRALDRGYYVMTFVGLYTPR